MLCRVSSYTVHLKKEQPLRHVLNELIADVLREELDSELELEGRLFAYLLCSHLCECVGLSMVDSTDCGLPSC